MTKLFTVCGVFAVSRATTMVPSVVSKVAVYFLAASIHIGGAFSNFVTRACEPSVTGHLVSPVSVAPGAVTTGVVAVGAVESVGVSTAVSDVVSRTVSVEATLEVLSPPVLLKMRTTSKTRATRPTTCRLRFLVVERRCCAASSVSRCWRFNFWRSLFSVPTRSVG
ncbi:unannotated protein [freshwater metagenome]|uniref:Unannotated protein n=1 Tax=freshwater metagenome TaxID=449393 RepID=A0A6J7RR81_9ZZZZ